MNNIGVKRTGDVSGRLGQLWKWFSLVDFRYTDAVALSRARLMLRICRVVVPIGVIDLIFVLARLGLPADPLLRVLSILAGLIVVIPELLVVRWIQRGKRQRAELLFTLSIAAAAIAVFFVHGFSDPILLVLLIPILISGFLYGRVGLSQATFAVVLVLILRAALDASIAPHQLAFAQSVSPPLFGVLFSVILFISISAILWVFVTVSGGSLLPNSADRGADMLAALVLTTIARYRTYQDIFERAAEDLRVQLGYYYVQLFVYDQPSGLLVRAGQRGTLNPLLREERRIALEDPHSIVADVARSTQPRLITGIADPSERAEFLAGTRAELLIPVQQDGALVGVFDIHSTQAGAFDAGEIAQLQAIGSLVAFALTRLKQSDEALASREEREGLRDQIAQLREQIGVLQRETVQRDWNQFLDEQPGGELGFVWNGEQIHPASISPAPYNPALALTTPQIRVENGQQVLIVPIVVRGQSLGGMAFYPADGIHWDDHSLDTASAIGQRLTLMVENLRLIEESRTAVLREQLINEVTTKLQTQTNLDELLVTAASVFSQSLGASSTKIRILPAENAPLSAATVTGPLSPRGLLAETAESNGENDT